MLTISELEEAKRVMVEYLKSKVKQEDWHGTADAAMDIREIDAKLSILRSQNTVPKLREHPLRDYLKNVTEA